MAEHDHWNGTWIVIFFSDSAPQAWLHSEAGVIAAGHGLPLDDLCLLVHHRRQFTNRSEGKEIAERTVRRSDARLVHLLKDLVAKQRKRPCAWRRGHVRGAAHTVRSERASGLPFKEHQPLRLFYRQCLE